MFFHERETSKDWKVTMLKPLESSQKFCWLVVNCLSSKSNNMFWSKKQENKSSSTHLHIHFLSNAIYIFSYPFRFKRSHQRRSSSSRNTSEVVTSVPPHWAPLDSSEEFKVVDLNEVLHHEEFTKVQTQFLATMSGHTIKSIKRVQNPGLWEDYER